MEEFPKYYILSSHRQSVYIPKTSLTTFSILLYYTSISIITGDEYPFKASAKE